MKVKCDFCEGMTSCKVCGGIILIEILRDRIKKQDRRILDLEKQIVNHKCKLPRYIEEALNSGDGTYKP